MTPSQTVKPSKAAVSCITVERLRQAQEAMPRMRHMLVYLRNETLPESRLEAVRVLEAAPYYEINGMGLLCKLRERAKGLAPELLVVIPEELRGEVVKANHIAAGHTASVRTYQRIRQQCYWPGMMGDVERYVKHCP